MYVHVNFNPKSVALKNERIQQEDYNTKKTSFRKFNKDSNSGSFTVGSTLLPSCLTMPSVHNVFKGVELSEI